MTMNNQGGMAYPAQSVRVEERILGITYERAVAMVPKLVALSMGAVPEQLTDGFFEVTVDADWSLRREMTVRLARQGADTRVIVRVGTRARWPAILVFIAVLMATMGMGAVLLLPWLIPAARKETRARELLVHRTFRALEDAVAAQTEAANYRVAPGLDAVVPAADEPEAGIAEETESVSRDLGARRSS